MSYTAYATKAESITVDKNGSKAEVTVQAPYTEAVLFAVTQVGGVRTVAGVPTFFIGAVYSRIEGLYCNQAVVTPLGDYDAGNLDWETAELKLSFGPLDQKQDDTDATEVADFSYEVSGQELVLPRGDFKTGSSSGDALDDNAPHPIKIVPTIALTASFKFKPELNPSDWVSYVGKINDDDFQGFEEGTVLFHGATVKRTCSSDGTDTWSHDFKFTVQPNGWNYIWKPNDSPTAGAWVELFPHQYEEDDLSNIF